VPRRQNLYKDFIEMAARCYVHALQHEEADIPGLVDLYAKIDRMRILSSGKIVEIAERIARKIVDTYSEPNKSFIELREMIDRNSVNLMREFSISCREELETTAPATLLGAATGGLTSVLVVAESSTGNASHQRGRQIVGVSADHSRAPTDNKTYLAQRRAFMTGLAALASRRRAGARQKARSRRSLRRCRGSGDRRPSSVAFRHPP
jgi:hypothetical protein